MSAFRTVNVISGCVLARKISGAWPHGERCAKAYKGSLLPVVSTGKARGQGPGGKAPIWIWIIVANLQQDITADSILILK